MRPKRKIFYWVRDTGKNSRLWFASGGRLLPVGHSDVRSNVKTCYTIEQAWRVCDRINAAGGRGLITMYCRRNSSRRERDMWMPGFVPWT